MIIFWTLAAGLAILALTFVLVPLLRGDTATPDLDSNALNLAVFRQQTTELDADLALGKLDQSQYEASRHDLERELIHDTAPNGAAKPAAAAGGRWVAPILALAVPAAAVGLYLTIGTSSIIPKIEAAGSAPSAQTAAGHSPARPDGSPMPSLDVLAQQLAERLEKNPQNAAGWLMLSRTWSTLHQSDKAMAAIERAYKVAPRDPAVLLAYAEALAETNGRQLAGRPVELLDTLMDVEPANPNGLWLRGMAAFQASDYPGALARWEPLLALLDPAGSDATQVTKLMDEARSRAGTATGAAGPGGAGAAPTQVTEAAPPATAQPVAPALADAPTPVASPVKAATPAPQAAAPAAKLTVTVALDPSLAAQAPRDASVFIYAKAVAGPPMPLAAQRVQVADLPVTLTLDDAMAMMPQMRLSAFPQVTVGARISRGGQAMPQSGDLEGEVSPVASNQAEPVSVTISRVRP
jgi:cytochrome c-type biogenesis protein CcmH